MIKQVVAIMLAIFFLVGCSASDQETADSQIVEEIAQEATEVPPTVEATLEVIEATDVPVVVEATIASTDVPVVVEPTSVPTMVEPTIAPTEVLVSNAYNAPDWVNLALVNARTGESFTLADFAGKTVFIEPMATWCSNCRAQQGYVSQAMDSLDLNEFVFISVSVGENVSNETLAGYADNNGFPQIFVVADMEFSNALVEQFGFSVMSPPSTPHFTISPAGTVSNLVTGSHRADALITELTTVQNG